MSISLSVNTPEQRKGLSGKQILDQLNKAELPEGITQEQASATLRKLAEDAKFLVHHNQSGGLPGGPVLNPSLARRFFSWLEKRFYSN